MKLIRLLLIGFLSTISLLACCHDAPHPTSSQLKIVADMDNGTPELYKNTTIPLKAIHVDGTQTNATWSATDIDGVNLSYDHIAGVTTKTVSLKVTDPETAKGTIIATYTMPKGSKAEGVTHTATYTIVPSTETVQSIEITPANKEIIIPHDNANATQAFVATAIFTDGNKFVITNDTDWSLPAISGGLTVDRNTGIVTATTDTTAIILTAKLYSITEVTGTTNVTAKKDTTPIPTDKVESFTIAGKSGGILPSTTGTLQMQVIETLAITGEQPPKDIVAGDGYTCTVEGVFGGANVDKDTCIVTGIKSGHVTVTATTTNPYTAIKTFSATIVIPHSDILKSFVIVGKDGTGMLPSTTGTLQIQVIETLVTGGKQPPINIVIGDSYTCIAPTSDDSEIIHVDEDTCIVTGIKSGSAMVHAVTTNTDSELNNSMVIVTVP